jgi:hypothetical protein
MIENDDLVKQLEEALIAKAHETGVLHISSSTVSRLDVSTEMPSGETAKKLFDPRPGQRVVFQPHEGTAQLTGNVVKTDENSVTIQCGRVTIPALREKGIFTEAPEQDRGETKEYAQERARKYVREKGNDNVFIAQGKDALYRGAIMELTPAFAIQKVGEKAILHRLKDIGKESNSLIQPGQEVSIFKSSTGEVFVEPWSEKEALEQVKAQGQGQGGISW